MSLTLLPLPYLFITTASKSTPELVRRAEAIGEELSCLVVPRHHEPLANCFEKMPEATRAIVVQKDRLLLVHRDGPEFFYHPNMGYIRLSNYLRGQNDWLLTAAEIQPTDAILDCTLGYAGEATLMATQIGETGEVHGIEGIPELGLIVREGLQTLTTGQVKINEAMRKIKVVHLGHHLEYLKSCPDKRYDIVYFDPFFDIAVDKQGTLDALRFFGDHSPLTVESLTEARRISRRFVIVKTGRWSHQLEEFGIVNKNDKNETFGSSWGTIVYGRIRV